MTDTVNMTDSKLMTNDVIIIIKKRKEKKNKNTAPVIPEKRLSLQFKCKFTSHYTLRTPALQAFYPTSSHGLAS